MQANTGFLLATPSTLNYRTPHGGEHQEVFLFSFKNPIFKQAPQLDMKLSILTSENFFIAQTHLAILNSTPDRRHSQDNYFLLKFLSFLSFQIDQRMERGMILNNNIPLPTNGDPLQASNNNDNELGKHQLTPHYSE